MKFIQYQVDAFTTELFGGNPAAVVPLDTWLPDALMQAIAAENNLAETAFFVPAGSGFDLRWFTPLVEVDLCGHATLASAHVLYEHLDYGEPVIDFHTRSGLLQVERRDGRLEMDFPSIPPVPCVTPATLADCVGATPVEMLAADDYIAVFENESDVLSIRPDFNCIEQLDKRALIVTAPGDQVDFVSRFFAPRFGIPEDPVTGAAHCQLTPFWAARLGKEVLEARQVSKRGGNVLCRLKGDRVILSGHAVTFMQAEMDINPVAD